MWLFRFLYSLLILVIFVGLREQIGLDVYYAVTYSLGIILAIMLIETLLSDMRSYKTFGALVGGVVFIFIGYIIANAFDTVFGNDAVELAFYFLVSYIGIFLGYRNYRLFENSIGRLLGGKSRGRGSAPKVLDTSTIIDGRIADVVDTRFLEGTLIIPTFVLKELQNIADSHDHLRRQKGRRGLNVLKRLQEQTANVLEIDTTTFEDIGTVDEKLVALAKKVGGQIITTDFNLLKVAEIQNIIVLNVNTLAMALRQTILPGEVLSITVVKEGKEAGQGIGYLDDGTMVVVEHGRKMIGNDVKLETTSLLQTESGRIIFGKMKS